MERSLPFDVYMHRYFLKNTEKMLTDEIIEMYRSGTQIIENIIAKRAKFYYVLPWVLSERIIFQKFMSEEKPVYLEDGIHY